MGTAQFGSGENSNKIRLLFYSVNSRLSICAKHEQYIPPQFNRRRALRCVLRGLWCIFSALFYFMSVFVGKNTTYSLPSLRELKPGSLAFHHHHRIVVIITV